MKSSQKPWEDDPEHEAGPGGCPRTWLTRGPWGTRNPHRDHLSLQQFDSPLDQRFSESAPAPGHVGACGKCTFLGPTLELLHQRFRGKAQEPGLAESSGSGGGQAGAHRQPTMVFTFLKSWGGESKEYFVTY